jgi:hypothetical protein
MPKSGFQARKDRVARGLPRYSPAELESRKRSDRERTYRRRRELVREIAAYKLAHGCADCGYNAHAAALDFDHLPGFEKRQDIARMVLFARTMETIVTEIAKCEIVCANCHRVRTATRSLADGSAGVAALEAEIERS